MFAFDFEGNELWKRNIEEDFGRLAYGWTPSTSPLIHDGQLILQILQRDVPVRGNGEPNRFNESYLLAMNPKTGEKLWRTLRPSNAQAESLEAFTSPVPYEFNGRKEILVAGGGCHLRTRSQDRRRTLAMGHLESHTYLALAFGSLTGCRRWDHSGLRAEARSDLRREGGTQRHLK